MSLRSQATNNVFQERLSYSDPFVLREDYEYLNFSRFAVSETIADNILAKNADASAQLPSC